MNSGDSNQSLMYVGSYTAHAPEGIHLYAFDLETGNVSLRERYSGLPNPSYLTVDSRRGRLYAVSETADHQGQTGGSVAAYRLEPGTGRLTFLDRRPTYGKNPCYLCMDPSGTCLLVANYSSGSLTLLPIEETGSLSKPAEVLQHHGKGPNPSRQERSHIHFVHPDPHNRYLWATDLGADKVLLYELDAPGKRLKLHKEIALHPGSGPRHIAFHPATSYAYVLHELDSSVTVLRPSNAPDDWTPVQRINLLPDDFNEESTAAAIHLSPDGRFVYGSNRGHDSIAVFGIDHSDGTLTLVEHVPTAGRTPRDFALTPNGRFLLAANMDSDSLVLFERDRESGRLRQTGSVIPVSQPVCIQIVT
jgi:6-phosphogluconolactonase